MQRNELPRIYELLDLRRNPRASSAYFQDFDRSIATQPVKLKIFKDIEADLQGLDANAWDCLKREVAPLFEKKHPTRDWQAAFDKLNQAKAYNFLKRDGCTEVQFIPEFPNPGRRTPDLKARQGTRDVLCEVKTINVSDDEAGARIEKAARSTQGRLPEAFFQKLRATLETAKQQMAGYYSGDDARRIVYVIVNFDDSLHEYVDTYSEQLQSFVTDAAVPEVDIIFDVKPAFYYATA